MVDAASGIGHAHHFITGKLREIQPVLFHLPDDFIVVEGRKHGVIQCMYSNLVPLVDCTNIAGMDLIMADPLPLRREDFVCSQTL